MQSRSPFNRSPFSGILGLVVALIFLYILFNLAFFVFKILWWVSPVLLIASLVIDHRVALGYIGSIKRLFERNWVFGLGAGVLTVVLFPLVTLYLLGMSLFKRKIKQVAKERDEQVNGKWTEFEEVRTEPEEMDISFEELPPAPEPELRRRDTDSDYDELFR